jgi:sugar/nucleoside kinase (ribokinase family)
MKLSIPVEGASAAQLKRFAGFCGAVLARAHARSGDAASIGGYLGNSDAFDEAIGEFALAYADQTVRDHAALVAAVKEGRVEALVEQDL